MACPSPSKRILNKTWQPALHSLLPALRSQLPRACKGTSLEAATEPANTSSTLQSFSNAAVPQAGEKKKKKIDFPNQYF